MERWNDLIVHYSAGGAKESEASVRLGMIDGLCLTTLVEDRH